MPRARSVLLILALLAGSLPPPGATAQVVDNGRPTGDDSPEIVLEQNYPDPVNPETWIPFVLSPSLFEENREVTATMRIINILNQVVAIPEAIDHPNGRGTRVINLAYTESGRKIAYWDGRDQGGRQVPSGVYYVDLTVGEERRTNKLIVLNNPRRRRTIFPW
jgi:hypothetical protein